MSIPSRTRLGRAVVAVAGLGLVVASVLAQGTLVAQAQSGSAAPQVSLSEVRIGSGDVCTEPVVVSVDVDISAPEGAGSLFVAARGVNQAEWSIGLLDTAPAGSSLGVGYSGTVDIPVKAGNPSGEWILLAVADGVHPVEANVDRASTEVSKSFTLAGNCADNHRGSAEAPIGRAPTVSSATLEQASVSTCANPARNAVVVKLSDFSGRIGQIGVTLDGPGSAPPVTAQVAPSEPEATTQRIPFELPAGTPSGTWSLSAINLTLSTGAPFTWQPTTGPVSFVVTGCDTATATPSPQTTMTPSPQATLTPSPQATGGPTSTPQATMTPSPQATTAPTATAQGTPASTATASPTTGASPTATATASATTGPVATATPTRTGLAYTGSASVGLTAFGVVVVLAGVFLVVASGRRNETEPS